MKLQKKERLPNNREVVSIMITDTSRGYGYSHNENVNIIKGKKDAGQT